MLNPRARAHAPKLLPGLRGLLRFAVDRRAPFAPKLLMFLAVVYLLFPLDLVPDVVPLFGWLDDIGLVSISISFLLASVARYEGSRTVEAEADGVGALQSSAELTRPEVAAARA